VENEASKVRVFSWIGFGQRKNVKFKAIEKAED